MTNKNIINIAILAHVDAGKTTLTEHILYKTGQLKELGDVNNGTASTDFLEVERQRGISVISSHTSFESNGIKVNIIDTPGHADFISEVKRSLLAVDAVVLIISAADGVQAQTKVLWDILRQYAIPTLIIVNKLDRLGIVVEDVVKNIQTELSASAVPIQQIKNESTNNVEIVSLRDYNNNAVFEESESIIEAVADVNDDILELFLQGDKISSDLLTQSYQHEVMAANLFPIMFSVAKLGIGISEIISEIISTFRIDFAPNNVFSAVVFNVNYSKTYGRLSYLRIFSGELHKKQIIKNRTRDFEEKINLLKAVQSDKLIDVNIAQSGDIVAVTGFENTQVGDVLGDLPLSRNISFENNAVLTVEVKPLNESDFFKLSEALSILNIEDPLLNFIWYHNEREFHLQINGWIQIQILEQIINDRFGIAVEFQTPNIIYKETISKSIIANGDYTMPKPCWAVISLKIEPGKEGSGVVYSSELSVNDVLLKYQKEVERTIPKALEQGIKGWEVTDVKITLIAGEDHVIHSRAGDFVIVTPMAIMNGLQEAGTDLLEPIMQFEINATDDILGQISSDLHNMRGEFSQPKFYGNNVRINGLIPAATSLEYPVQLASRSGGKASIQMKFHSYRKVDTALGKIKEFKGISPLDRSKYILQARNAMK